MFASIYSSTVTASEFFFMAAAALVTGFLYAWLISYKIRSTKRFFIVAALIPFVVASVITFVNGNIGAGVAIGGAFSLIRFRSAQGSADEIASILIAMGSGIAFGMGFLAYGVLILLGLSVIFCDEVMVPLGMERLCTYIYVSAAIIDFVLNLVLIPPFGVYATVTRLENGARYAAVTNIGVRPTVDESSTRVSIESWLLDFNDDLYGQRLRVELYDYLRAEQKFPSLEHLVQAIHRNRDEVRAYMEEHPELLK